MRTINNQFEKKQTVPRITITDSTGTSVTFGDPNDSGTDYGRVFEVSIDKSVDSDSTSADMSFRNHPDMKSLDPLDSNSDFNDGTIATDLMDKYHDVKIELTKDDGSNWYTVFEGFVGDVSARKRVSKDDIIQFSPYDKSKPLKDAIILEGAPNQPLEYYNIDAFDCADAILSDISQYEGYDYNFNLTINRSISDNPNKTVSEYKVKNTSVWDALKEIFAQTGYKLFFWYDGSGGYDLAVINPHRGKISTVDHSFTGDFDQRSIDLNDRNVRSQVVVFYNDRDNNGTRRRVTVENDTVRQNYGAPNFNDNRIHRTMVLKEDSNSLIDTETEANAYANDALNDLRSPTPDVELSFPYAMPGVQLYDKVEAGGTNDYTVQMGVSSISYSFEDANKIGTTTLRGVADRVIGEKSYWLNKGQLPDDIEASKGDRKPPPKPDNPPRLEKTTYVDESSTTRTKVIAYGEHSSAWDVEGYQFRYRVKNTDTGNTYEWKYPDQIKQPQKTITGLEVGKNLELQVEYSAIDWENTEWSGSPGDSPYSDTATISLYTDIVPPSPPSNLTATADVRGIALEWDKPTTSKDGSDLTDLDTFIVYWNSTSSFDISNADGFKDVGKTEAFTQELPSGTTRYYKVTAQDNSNNESLASNETSATADSAEIDDVSAYDWSSNLTFSSTDTDTVSWTSGTLTTGNGNSYSINSGNTGNMSSTTYIYFDGDTSTTDLQTTTTASTAVGSNQILIAVAENATDGAKFQVFGGQGGQFITASEVAADTITFNEIAGNTIKAAQIESGTITATEIDSGTITATELAADSVNTSELVASSVTATEINVNNLSAIEADMGTLTAGKIQLESGKIEIGDDVLGTDLHGILVNDGTNDRVRIGELSSGTYGMEARDASGKIIWNSSGDFVPLAFGVNSMLTADGDDTAGATSWDSFYSTTGYSSFWLTGGFVMLSCSDANASSAKVKITDDSGSITINNINKGTNGSSLNADDWQYNARLFNLPSFQADGDVTIEVYNPDSGTRKYTWQVVHLS